MKFSKTILSAALLASVSTTTFADTYNGEVGLEYVNNGIAIADSVLPVDDVSSFRVRGTYNFSAVDTANKPLGEADFLGKHSFINASYSSIDPDDFDRLDSQTIGVGFYIPNSIFFIGAEYLKIEDFNDTMVTVGITPLDGLLITTSHNDEAEDYNANISAKYVTQFAGDTALNLEAGYAKGEDAGNQFEEDEKDAFYVAADYYFTSRFSVGASVVDQDESTYRIRTRYFLNEKVSLNAEHVSEDGTNTLVLGAAIRF